MTSTSTESLTLPAAGTYTFDSDRTTIEFATRHLFGLAAVRGTFTVRSGQVVVGTSLSTSRVTATADAASFSTGHAKRDPHVRSADFLHTDEHPEIVFSSTRVEQDDKGTVVHGTLLARGTEAPLALRVIQADTLADGSIEFRASGTVDRYQHGITKMKGMAARHLTLTVKARAHRI